MTKRLGQLIWLWIVAAVVIGCDKSPSTGLRTVKMTIGSRTYTLEVAETVEDRRKGLMFRESMPADHGMLFVFPEEEELSFWMRNTRIPLDIIFINSAGQVVRVAQMKPYDESSVPSGRPAIYAIELNQGEVEKNGVREGMTLEIPADVQK
jgi:uncharacterized membrane protein (UPF0127 family)